MACSKHGWTNPDWCAACRSNAWQQQSARQHTERMNAINPPPPPAPSHLGRNMLLAVVVVIPVLLVLGLLVGLVMGLFALVALLLQGLLAGALVGALVGGVTYAVLRHRNPEAPAFEMDRPDRALPVKERALAVYASLDPNSAKATRAGLIAGAITLTLVVLT